MKLKGIKILPWRAKYILFYFKKIKLFMTKNYEIKSRLLDMSITRTKMFDTGNKENFLSNIKYCIFVFFLLPNIFSQHVTLVKATSANK